MGAANTLKAIDKAIVLGSAMDGDLLKAAASAHHQAIGSIDGAGVTSAADYATVTVGGDKIGAAAQALADQSYPFLKSVDWTSDHYLKPMPSMSSRTWLRPHSGERP